jgi:hypothetical protein
MAIQKVPSILTWAILLVLSGLVTTGALGQSMNYQVLSDLYNSTNGPQWTDSTNWFLAEPCPNGYWFGIVCDTHGNINQM